MGGVRHDDFFARVAVGLVVRADQQDAGELALRAGGGLQRDGVHAGDLEEALGEVLHDAECTLRECFGLVRVCFGQAFEAGDGLIDAGVVLHGAGAQRVHAEIDGVVPGRKPREVADDLDLGELRHDAEVVGAGGVAEQGGGVDGGNVQRGEAVSLLPGGGLLKDQIFVLVYVCGRLLGRSDEFVCHAASHGYRCGL